MKKHLSATIAVLSAAALLAGSTVPASAAPKKPRVNLKGTVITDEMFGLHVKNAQQGVWPDVKFGSLRLWDNDTSWANIEVAPGVFDWTNLDAAVANAEKNGVTDILMVLAGTPAWASTSQCQPPNCLPTPGAAGMPADLSLWDRWVTNVATRYKGRINNYQPWNEANLQTFFEGTPAQMADLTERTYNIIKAIDPTATVVAPSTGTRLGGPFKKFYPKYLKELGARGWPVDVWSVHTYPASLGTTRDRYALAETYMKVLNAAGAPQKPIWDTENNYGLKGPGPKNPDVDIEGQRAADWTAITYLDALRLGISRVYMYTWEPANDLWGIQYYTNTRGAQAFSTVQDWLVGSTYRGCKVKANKVTCNFLKNGKKQQVVYSANGKKKNFTAPRGYSNVCYLNGQCTKLTRSKVRTSGPVMFTK